MAVGLKVIRKKGEAHMSNRRALLQVLLGIVMFGGVCSAGEKTLSLGMNVTPSISDKTSRFEFRTTTTYDSVSANGGKLYVGATDAGAKEYAVSALTTADSGLTIDKAALAPALIYSNPSDTSAALIANPVYNARIWELSYFPCFDKLYVAAIVQAAGDSGNGGSLLAVINVADPKETYISATATTLENEVAGTAGAASKFVKLAVGDNYSAGAPTQKIVFAAIADPTIGEFDTSKATVGLRAFTAPKTSSANNSLVELDMNSSGVAATKGVKLGLASTMMSTKMKRLTSMVWDVTSRVLYLGGYMLDGFPGICGFYLAASDVLTTLNHSTGGTLLDHGTNVLPELSNVHSLSISKYGSSNPHLIIQSGTTPQEKNRFFTLGLVTGAAGTAGKFSQGVTNTAATQRSEMWLAKNTNTSATGLGLYTTAARCVIGNASISLPAGAFITHVSVLPTGTMSKVYVSTWNAGTGSEVWVSTVTRSGVYANTWTNWQKISNTELNKVTAFATNGSYVWAVLDRKSAYVKDSTGSAVTIAQPSLGLANVKDSATRTRLRQVAVFDAVNRTMLSAATAVPNSDSMKTVNSFNAGTRATASATEATTASPVKDAAIWDMATITNGSGYVDKYYLVHTEIAQSPSSGGKVIVKVPGDGSAITSISSAVGQGVVSVAGYTGDTPRQTFFQDAVNGDSRCLKIVAGQKLNDGTPVLFCFIPESGATDAQAFRGHTFGSSGYNDMIKVLDANLVPIGSGVAYRSTIGSMTGNMIGMQSAYFDYSSKYLYVGSQKATGDDYPGLSVYSISTTTLSGAPVFSSGWAGSLGTDDSVRDIYKIANLRTVGTTPRNILLMAGTVSGDFGDSNPGGVYAIPVSSTGTAVQANYTTAAAQTNTGTVWRKNSSPHLFYVGGSTLPWDLQAAVMDIKVVSNGSALTSPPPDVYVTIANPPGMTSPAGVFRTTAVCAANGDLVGWTPWVSLGGSNASAQTVAIDDASGRLIAIDLASGQPIVPAWKASTDTSMYDQLAEALNTDFANEGGVYNIASYRATNGIVHNNATGTARSMQMVVATGNKKVALAHVGFKDTSIPQFSNNPSRTDIYSYKTFLSDSALQSLGQIYCSAMSPGSNGWVFVGGQKGVAVLRVAGAGAHAGKGWTTNVPSSLQDVNGSATALADMTWLKVPDIDDVIREMTVVFDTGTSNKPVVVALGAKAIYAFIADGSDATYQGKFKDTPASAMSVQTLLPTAFGPSERIWDIAPLYARTGRVLVGTTKGLYHVAFNTNAWGTPTEITDGSASLGSVASIHVTSPVLGAGSDLSVNPVFMVDCLTAKARTDSGKHFRFPITLNETNGAPVGTPTAILVRALDRMATQVISDGAVTTYHAAKPTAKAASVDVLSKSLEVSGAAVSDGLIAAKGSSMGRIAIIGADGAKLVTVGGRVYVQSV